jgi:DNA mismatch endonuclease (patch repair protein)
MRAVKGKNTALELRLRSLLWRNGVRGYRCHVASVTGRPDLSWRGLRVAVFIDSAWWHGHPSRWAPGRLPEPWDVKIARTRQRDKDVTAELIATGWTVVRIWDFELDEDSDLCIHRVRTAVEARRSGVPQIP